MAFEIIRKATTPDGVAIQFECWNGTEYSIGAYPKAKATGKYGLVRTGETFRLFVSRFENLSEAAGFFDGLRDGCLKLTDEVVQNHYWYPVKDRYYMGLCTYEGV